MGGHQTRRCCQINLLVPRTCVAASGAQAISDLEPQVNAVGNCRALCRVACNFLRVAAQVGYTSGWSCEGRKCVRWCRERCKGCSALEHETTHFRSRAVICLGFSHGSPFSASCLLYLSLLLSLLLSSIPYTPFLYLSFMYINFL